MDIFEILKEAKNPSKPTKPETVFVDDDPVSTKYIDDTEDNINDTEDDDYTDTDNTDSSDPDESEEDTNLTDYTTKVEDVSLDNGDEPRIDNEGDSSDENSSDEQNDKDDIVQSISLLDSTIKLYFDIKEVIKKLDKLTEIDVVANKIIIQSRKNFIKMTDELYDFITRTYNLNSYVKNLYTYNYFIEAYRINVEMLKKISVFTINT